MRARLALSLTSTRLLAEVLRPAAGSGFHGLLRSLPFLGRGQSPAAAPEVAAGVGLSGAIAHDVLRARLEQALSELKAGYDGSLAGLDLEVQLGLDHARVGVMVLEDVAATSLASSTREAYAQAWVRQMLHLAPETQVIRWQILADPHKLLISCVDRHVFDVLQDFALEHRMRFVSCRPAVLAAVAAQRDEHAGDSTSLTVVWTEAGADARRSGSVQLLRFEGKQLSAAWRGWVSPGPATAGDGDTALEGAIRRFKARNPAQGGDALNHVHWPAG